MSANIRRSWTVCCAGVLLALALSSTTTAYEPSVQARFSVYLEKLNYSNVGTLTFISSESVASGESDSGSVVTHVGAPFPPQEVGTSASAQTKSLYVYADARAAGSSYNDDVYAGYPSSASQSWSFVAAEDGPVNFTFQMIWEADLWTEYVGEQAIVVFDVLVTLRNSTGAAVWSMGRSQNGWSIGGGPEHVDSFFGENYTLGTGGYEFTAGEIGYLDLTVTARAEAHSHVSPAAVDDLVSVSLGKPRFVPAYDETRVAMTITNTSQATIDGPVWVVVESISDPYVRLAGSGTTPDGYPYVDATLLLRDNHLDPGKRITPRLAFHIEYPEQREFTFTYSIRGMAPPK